MNKLEEDIEKWNQILCNYIGACIKSFGFGGGAKYSFNLLDSLYQQKILELKNIDNFRDISIYSDITMFFNEENESIFKCMYQQNIMKNDQLI